MIRIWTGKKSDFLLAMLYFILYGTGIHILVSIKRAMKYDENVMIAITNPGSLLFSIGLLFFVMSPIGLYFRKIPKKLILNYDDRQMEIHKKRRKLIYDLNRVRYAKRETKFFFILEIHATFDTSRGGEIEKMATSIIVPNWGLSWNRKVMNELIEEFKKLEIQEIQKVSNTPISEYFYN